MSDRVLIAMTGATGQIYGRKALKLLQKTDYETHLVLSNAAKMNINQEATWSVEAVESLADEVYSNRNVGAAPASGSFSMRGMLIAPCSMKTLSNIAHGNAGNLITRSADVMLKERRPLVLMPREKPFNRIHLKNMLEVTDAGGIIMPPFPSFYQRPDDIDEIIERTMARSLSLLDIEMEIEEWTGLDVNE